MGRRKNQWSVVKQKDFRAWVDEVGAERAATEVGASVRSVKLWRQRGSAPMRKFQEEILANISLHENRKKVDELLAETPIVADEMKFIHLDPEFDDAPCGGNLVINCPHCEGAGRVGYSLVKIFESLSQRQQFKALDSGIWDVLRDLSKSEVMELVASAQ